MGRSQLRPNLCAGGCKRDPIVQGARESLGGRRGLCPSLSCEHGHEISWEKGAAEEQGRSPLKAHTMVESTERWTIPSVPVALARHWGGCQLHGHRCTSRETPAPPPHRGLPRERALPWDPPSQPHTSTKPQSSRTQEAHSTAAQALTLRHRQESSPNQDVFDPRCLH